MCRIESSLSVERYGKAQEDNATQGREFDSLKKRYEQLNDQRTRLDIACNHATEMLHEANAQIEKLRNDCANLKAEKQIAEVSQNGLYIGECYYSLLQQNTQNRLLDENRMIAIERTRLSDLISNVQRMHHEIERTNESDRRRFETQIKSLETQTYVSP